MLQFIPSALYILHVSNYVVKQQQSDRVRRLSKQDAVPLNLNMKGLLALHPKTTGHNVYCCTEPLAYFLARLSDIEPRLVCKACGKLGADVRPHFEPARMGPTEAALPRNEETNRQTERLLRRRKAATGNVGSRRNKHTRNRSGSWPTCQFRQDDGPRDEANTSEESKEAVRLFEGKGGRTVQPARPNMRNDWTMTPSEMALFIAAVTCLAGGFVMAAGG